MIPIDPGARPQQPHERGALHLDAGPGGRHPGAGGDALQDAAEQFARMMSGGGEDATTLNKQDAQPDAKHLAQGEEAELNAGDALLRGILGAVPHGAETALATAEKQLEQQAMSQVTEAISERLLVSDGSGGTSQEVRITLKEEILPGVEIRIWRELGGLIVLFVCKVEESAKLIGEHRDQLLELLSKKQPGAPVEVRVEDADGNDLAARYALSSGGLPKPGDRAGGYPGGASPYIPGEPLQSSVADGATEETLVYQPPPRLIF